MRPSDTITAARLARPGPDLLRVLVVAGPHWLAAAASASSADSPRLPSRLLDRLWLTSRHGVELDIVCGVGRVLRQLDAFPDAWNPARFDAVILLPDPGRRRMPSRLVRVVERMVTATEVVIACVEPDGGRPGAERSVSPAGVVRLPIRLPAGAAQVATVVDAIAAELAGLIDIVPVRRPGRSGHLQRIAQMASTAFAVDSVTIAVTGPGPARTLAHVGTAQNPAQCLHLGARTDAQIVLDTWRDPRLATDPAVRGGAVRFFATQPIETTAGIRFGTMSVSDAVPRMASDFDADVLRDLAQLAGAEIQYAAATA